MSKSNHQNTEATQTGRDDATSSNCGSPKSSDLTTPNHEPCGKTSDCTTSRDQWNEDKPFQNHARHSALGSSSEPDTNARQVDPNRQIIIAEGRNKSDKFWSNTGQTAEKWVKQRFGETPVGNKDGRSFCQGQTVDGGGRRTKTTWVANHIIGFDVDTGATMDEICNVADQRGLSYIAYHTHSHLKEYSRVSEALVGQLLKKHGMAIGDENATDDNIRKTLIDYFRDVKGVKEPILESVTGLRREMTPDGMVYDLTHAPMPRVRILFFLETAFDFTRPPTHEKRQEIWTQAYHKAAHVLEIPIDASCSDPSRLFYYPRRPEGSDPEQFEIRVKLDGDYLNLDKYCEIADSDPMFKLPQKFSKTKKSGSSNVPKDLIRFAAKYGERFKIADWLEQEHADECRSEMKGDEKIDFRCPNADAHSDGDNEDDRGFFVKNGTVGSSFVCSCQHTTCKSMSSEDRLFYLNLLMKNKNVDLPYLTEHYVEGCDEQDHAGSFQKNHNILNSHESARKIQIMRNSDARAELESKISQSVKELNENSVTLEVGGIKALFPLLDDVALVIESETEIVGFVGTIAEKIKKPWRQDLKRELKNRFQDAQRLLHVADAEDVGTDWLPAGYLVRGVSIYKCQIGDPQSGAEIEVCGLFRVVGNCFDESGCGHGIEIAFDVHGVEKSAVIEKSLLAGDGRQIREELMDAGLYVSTQAAARNAFNHLLNTLHSSENITNASKPGWHAGNTVFLSPLGQAITDNVDHKWRLNKRACAKDAETKGTLDAWKRDVAEACFHPDTPHFALGIAMAGAGTLLQLIGEPSCGIGLIGPSSRGKSLAQKISTSAWGNPKPDQSVLLTCRATDNALESKAARSNGTVLHLDEAKTGNAKLITQLPFFLSSGTGRSRMRADGSERYTATWNTFFTYSSERPIEHFAVQMREPVVTGSTVRAPEVDVSGLTPLANPAEAKAIGDAAEANYGHAGPEFVAFLINNGFHKNPEQIRQLINARERCLLNGVTDAAQQRASRVLATLWVAGDLMQQADLITHDIQPAVQWGLESYLNSSASQNLNGAARSVDRLIEWVAHNPRQIGEVSKYRTHDKAYHEILAWRKDSTLFLPASSIEKLTDVITTTETAFVEELDRRGILQRQGKNKAHGHIPTVGQSKHYRLDLKGLITFDDDEDEDDEDRQKKIEAPELGGDTIEKEGSSENTPQNSDIPGGADKNSRPVQVFHPPKV